MFHEGNEHYQNKTHESFQCEVKTTTHSCTFLLSYYFDVEFSYTNAIKMFSSNSTERRGMINYKLKCGFKYKLILS